MSKIILIIELINNIAKVHGSISVLSGMGELTCERNDLYMKMKESRVINEKNIVEFLTVRPNWLLAGQNCNRCARSYSYNRIAFG